jgi:protein-tyrosine phosphatase
MELFPVEGPWPGRLAVCSRPRSGNWLEDDIRSLKRAGHDLLISALTPEETAKLELERMPEVCLSFGVRFVNFPVGNMMVPSIKAARPHLEAWHAHLELGGGVAVHCFASVGRSPTLAAALLVLAGVPAADAWARLEAARGREVPDTTEQRMWVNRLDSHQAGATAHLVDG